MLGNVVSLFQPPRMGRKLTQWPTSVSSSSSDWPAVGTPMTSSSLPGEPAEQRLERGQQRDEQRAALAGAGLLHGLVEVGVDAAAGCAPRKISPPGAAGPWAGRAGAAALGELAAARTPRLLPFRLHPRCACREHIR